MAIKAACYILSLIVYFISFSAAAETKVTGFASMVGGLLTHGDQFLADYPNTGLYDSDLSFSPDTTIGVQLKTTANEEFEFVTQLISRGANEFETDIDWAYINYTLNPELSFQFGRKRLPLYFYSDFYDLGFAYHWIRPPSDNYTWQITNYNGVSLYYEPETEYWDTLFNFYLGREDDNENNLLSFLANPSIVDESWRNILGFVSEFSDETFELRFTLMASQLYRKVNGTALSEGVNQLFYGVSVNANFSDYLFLSELNRYERQADAIEVTTYMLSIAKKIGSYTPHLTYSELKQSAKPGGGDEFHFTYSLGIRKELNQSTALKIQFDSTTDNGINTSIVGDGDLLSFGLDIVF